VEKRTVECLNCGTNRRVGSATGECVRCGYVGWAESESLTETLRRALRDRPVERRKLHVVH
jgi:Zn ribbon nucleic-acid-binding protein